MSFFRVGETYRDFYHIEHVVPFFDGELAIARHQSKRYYLQSTHLQKQAPSRAIQQYRSLNHPLVIPFLEVYTEERSLVFIRPYDPIQPLKELVSTSEVDEDQVVEWGKQLLRLAAELQAKPIPMYLLLDSRNIGVAEDGSLKVIFCGLEQITALSSTLDWGSFFYSLLSGEYLEEPITQLPKHFSVSKLMERLIQKSLNHKSIESVVSQIDTYEKKKHGKGLLGRLFGGNKKVEEKEENVSSILPKPKENLREIETSKPSQKPSTSSSDSSSDLALVEQRKFYEKIEQERLKQEPLEGERLEQERQERFLQELERLKQERLEWERKERERLEQERLAFERREQELRKMLEELNEVDQQSKELEQTSPDRFRETERQINSERLEQEHKEQERLKREKEERQMLRKERIARENEEHEQLAKQFEEYMKKMLNKD